MIGGVCSGIAEYFAIDPTLVRIVVIFAVLACLGLPVIVYLLAWIIMPLDPSESSGYIDASATAHRPEASQSQEGGAENAQAQAQPKPKGRWSWAVILGALLVCIGLFALLGQLVSVSFWRFWPLILIVIGLIQLFTPGAKGWSLARAGSAISLSTIGAVLLAWTLGVVPFTAFISCVFNLWPVLLIVIGLGIIGSAKRLSAFNLAGSLLFSLTLILGTWFYGGIAGPVSVSLPGGNQLTIAIPSSPGAHAFEGAGIAQEISSIDLGGLKEANLVVTGGGVNATLAASDKNQVVLQASPDSRIRPELRLATGDPSTVTMDLSADAALIGFMGVESIHAGISKSVVWNSLSVQVGAIKLDADLSGLRIKSLDVSTGAASCSMRLGEPLDTSSRVDLKGGAAAVSLLLPRNAAAIIYTSGLNAMNIDDRRFIFVQDLGAYCSTAYIEKYGHKLVDDSKVWVIRQSGMMDLKIGAWDE
jgi:phage shock protein PspC (stress-responsive transcriptional regulator)